MPVRFVRLTFVRREDCIIFLISRKWYSVPSVRLQPLVKLVLIQEPSSAWLGGWNGAVFLLLDQQGSHAHHLIPKLGDDLRKVVECKFIVLHKNRGLWLETGGKGTE